VRQDHLAFTFVEVVMKSLLEVILSILDDVGMQCGANPLRDQIEVARRVEDEGESFLTITLPTLAAGLEKALAAGHWSPAYAPAFSCGKRRSLPRFLGGFFDQVFDEAGRLRQPNGEANACIWAIRQVCRCVSKMYAPATQSRVDKALRRFADVEQEVRDHAHSQKFFDAFKKVSEIVWKDIYGDDGSIRSYREFHPRHGSGTTAEAIRGNQKFDFRVWHQRLNTEFRFSEFGISSIRNSEGLDLACRVSYSLPRDESPVKVTPVPKTAKTPRIIAI
jgi:hypothetical protein